ncbi:MAG: putative toxin-antitoxin system toxin component, PIN family [Pyrinomonadaceae bacterium]
MKIRVVFDCNTFLQAAINEESHAGNCYRLVEEGTVELFVSEDVLEEIEDVINRPQIKERFTTLTADRIEEFLKSIRELAVIVRTIPKVFSLPRDIDDEIYINLAVEAEADFIVTRDKDLIDLMSGYDLESKQFRQKFRPLKIVQPLEFLRLVEEKIKDPLYLKP